MHIPCTGQEPCIYGNAPAVKCCCWCGAPLCGFCGSEDAAGCTACNECYSTVVKIAAKDARTEPSDELLSEVFCDALSKQTVSRDGDR